MSDDDRPIPTTEEMKTALASLDLKLARIFRARLRLAAAEPEPPAPTAEPEPSMAEPVVAPELDIKPAAPATDPAARQRLEAEINDKAGATRSCCLSPSRLRAKLGMDASVRSHR